MEAVEDRQRWRKLVGCEIIGGAPTTPPGHGTDADRQKGDREGATQFQGVKPITSKGFLSFYTDFLIPPYRK